MQELFPQSYAQTAGWLQRKRMANQDTLARCRSALQAALGAHPALQPLAAGCQVTLRTLRASGLRYAPARTCWRAAGPRGRPRWAQSGAAAAGCQASADLGLGIWGVRKFIIIKSLSSESSTSHAERLTW